MTSFHSCSGNRLQVIVAGSFRLVGYFINSNPGKSRWHNPLNFIIHFVTDERRCNGRQYRNLIVLQTGLVGINDLKLHLLFVVHKTEFHHRVHGNHIRWNLPGFYNFCRFKLLAELFGFTFTDRICLPGIADALLNPRIVESADN